MSSQIDFKGSALHGVAVLALFFTAESAFASAPDPISRLLRGSTTSADLSSAGFPGARFSTLKDVDAASPSNGLEACILEVANINKKLQTIDIRKEARPPTIFRAYSTRHTIGVINGGFFGLQKNGTLMPLGLLKVNSKIVSRIHPWTSGGVLFTEKDNVKISHISTFKDSPKIQHAIQSKPILIENGQDGIRTGDNHRFDRSAIAVAQNGTIIFIVLHEPGGKAATLKEFSRFLLGLRTTAGAPILNAIAMDGGPGAHLYIPPLEKDCGSGIPNFIPNAVRIER